MDQRSHPGMARIGAEKPHIVKFMRSLFDKMDKNKDGHLSRAEISAGVRQYQDAREVLGLPESPFEQVFRSMDVDGSDRVSLEAFIGFLEGQVSLEAVLMSKPSMPQPDPEPEEEPETDLRLAEEARLAAEAEARAKAAKAAREAAAKKQWMSMET